MYPIADLTALARRHLHDDEAERWIAQLSVDGFHLTVADGDEPVGRLGGEPDLPAEVEWPIWDGHGPLAFVAAIDCAAMARRITEYPWPTDGTLLFFYFDGQADNGESWVTPSDPRSLPGSRVLHVPAGVPTAPRATPEPLKPFPVTPLVAEPAAYAPRRTDSGVSDLDYDAAFEHPRLTALDDAVEKVRVGAFGVPHQIGGHAKDIQADVHFEAAMASLGRDWGDDEDEDEDPFDDPMFDPEVQKEAGDWKLLLQVSSDRDLGLMWGDAGNLYWLIKAEDLAELRLDRAYFTWQCH